MNISVIIPTYNRLALLPRAIDSVMAQTLLPHQIVVVDDGSTDGTFDFVRRHYPDIELIRQSQKGVSAARNVAIQAASAEWIALLDSDDEWMPDKLARQQQAVSESSGQQVCHTDEIWIRNGKRVNPMNKHRKPGGWIYQQCLPLCCVSPSAVLLHQNVLDTVGVFDESYTACEDYELWLRVFHRFEALLVDQPLVKKYGGHDDQLSRKYWGMDRFRVRAIASMLDNTLLDKKDHQQSLRVLEEKCRILGAGARKREKFEEAEYYRALAVRYLSEQ